MTRFSRIFFGLLVAVLLVWQLPWGVNYLTVKSEGTPFTLYSEVLGDFAMIRRGGKELEYLDRRGNRYGQRQFDSLLPLFYARQLVADGRFPDSIAGRAVSPREAQAATFVFRSTPQDVNTPVSGIRFLLESMSGRVDLAMPDDAFRLTASGIEFIDMASNTVDTAKSALFTGTMRRKGVRFPVAEISGNPSARKEYDEGYVLLDADRRLFHLKMVQGRPSGAPLHHGVPRPPHAGAPDRCGEPPLRRDDARLRGTPRRDRRVRSAARGDVDRRHAAQLDGLRGRGGRGALLRRVGR